MVSAATAPKTESTFAAGIQETDLGVLPNDWDVVELGNIGSVSIGLTYSPRDVSADGTLVLRSSNVQNGQLRFDDNVYVNVAVPDRATVRENDILICVRNGSRELIGKSAVIDASSAGMAFGAFMAIYRSEHNGFLAHVFKSDIMLRQIHEHLGATINQITNKSLNGFKVPLPKNPMERTAVAEALSDASALIESLEQLIAKKRAIRQCAMHQLLTPQHDWIEVRLGDSAQLKARIGWQGLTTSEYLESGDYHLVTGTEFFDGFIDWDNCHYVDKARYDQDKYIQIRNNDVLVTKDGTIGKVAFVDNLPLPATLNSGVFVIRPLANAFHPKFFYYLLMSPIFSEFLAKLSAGSTISHLYQKDFVKFSFFVPPTEQQQEDIASTLMDMDRDIRATEVRLTQIRRMRQGMMQELLTGRTRLV